MKEEGYNLWIQRLQYSSNIYDLVRIDLFGHLIHIGKYRLPVKPQSRVHGLRDHPMTFLTVC